MHLPSEDANTRRTPSVQNGDQVVPASQAGSLERERYTRTYRTPAPLTGRRLLALLLPFGRRRLVPLRGRGGSSARDRGSVRLLRTNGRRPPGGSLSLFLGGRLSMRVVVIFRFALSGFVLLVLHLLPRASVRSHRRSGISIIATTTTTTTTTTTEEGA